MNLSPSNRILLNIVASYGRSVVAMLAGIFTSRWALMSLGETDYGLYSVIGGLTVFIAFFNNVLAGAIARFYAFAVGEAQVLCNKLAGVDLCRQWFNTALLIHIVIPVILILIGYPLGEWAVRHWLTIPAERIPECVTVFRLVCLACFINMISVPFQAMYVAKQLIAELTIYSFGATICNFFMLFYMVNHQGNWLTWYATGICIIAIIPQLLIIYRAWRIFPECQIILDYMVNYGKLKQICTFFGWQIFGNFGALMRTQGISLLVNKMFGPIYNSTVGLSNVVAAQTGQLSAALNTAFVPALTTHAGANHQEKMLQMAYLSCKFGLLLTLIFCIPISLELHEIIRLWLKTPPPFIDEVCLLTLVILAIDASCNGCGIAVTANGKIATYYTILGIFNMLIIPAAWLVLVMKWGDFISIFVTSAIVRSISVIISIFIAKKLINFSPFYWLRFCLLPTMVSALLSLSCGLLVQACNLPQWLDFMLTILISCSTFSIFAALFVLTRHEKDLVKEKIYCFMKAKNEYFNLKKN